MESRRYSAFGALTNRDDGGGEVGRLGIVQQRGGKVFDQKVYFFRINGVY
jgi:hypothetical protein